MKKLICLLLIVLSFSTFAQVKYRLGEHFTDVSKEIKTPVKLTNDKTRYLSTQEDGVVAYYYFNQKDVCNVQINVYHKNKLVGIIKNLMADNRVVKINNLEYLFIDSEDIVSYEIEFDGELMFLTITLQ